MLATSSHRYFAEGQGRSEKRVNVHCFSTRRLRFLCTSDIKMTTPQKNDVRALVSAAIYVGCRWMRDASPASLLPRANRDRMLLVRQLF